MRPFAPVPDLNSRLELVPFRRATNETIAPVATLIHHAQLSSTVAPTRGDHLDALVTTTLATGAHRTLMNGRL